MNDYRDVQIIKHALQHYIKRDGITETDLQREKALLKRYEEKADILKRKYGINRR